jgi:hypothetical protein
VYQVVSHDNRVAGARRAAIIRHSDAARYTYNGETLSVRDWAEKLGVTVDIFRGRLKAGKTGEALFAPGATGGKHVKHSFRGRMMTLGAIARESEISVDTLRSRLLAGVDLDTAVDELESKRGTRKDVCWTPERGAVLSEIAAEFGWSRQGANMAIDRAARQAMVGDVIERCDRWCRVTGNVLTESELVEIARTVLADSDIREKLLRHDLDVADLCRAAIAWGEQCDDGEETPAEKRKKSRRGRPNKSGVTGVSWHKGIAKWVAYVPKYPGPHVYLGSFESLDDAAQAVRDAIREQGE